MYKDRKTYIRQLLDRFMNGTSTLEEERQLTAFFQTEDVPEEWRDYQQMFAYFGNGMTTTTSVPEKRHKGMGLNGKVLRRYFGIAASLLLGIFVLTLFLSPQEKTEVAMVTDTKVERKEHAKRHTLPPKVEQKEHKTFPKTYKGENLQKKKADKPKKANIPPDPMEEMRAVEAEITQCQATILKAEMEVRGYQAVRTEDGDIIYIHEHQTIEI